MELGPLSDDIDLTTGRSHSRPGLGPCGHRTAEPVRLLDDGQIVAWLCQRCDTQLPADWTPAPALPEFPPVPMLPPFVPDPRLTARICE